VPRLAEPHYQTLIQSVTSMAFTLGTPLGALWVGLSVDPYGLPALMVGAGVLVMISMLILIGGGVKPPVTP